MTGAVTQVLGVRSGAVADQRVTDDVQLVTAGELGHVEPEPPGQPVDVVQHQTEVVCRRTSSQT